MQYNCVIEEKGNMFIVKFPDLPNVMTYGESEEDALVQAKDALNGCLAADVAQGNMPIFPEFKGKGSHAVEVDTATQVAMKLRSLRGNKSQSEIAARLGISYQAYQRLENPGKGNPSVKTLDNVARAFGLKLSIQFEVDSVPASKRVTAKSAKRQALA
jgi:antitoxin HicB